MSSLRATSARPVPFRLIAILIVGVLSATLLGARTPAAAASPFLERRLSDPRILESSGLARSGYDDNVLWTHNDRGDSARIFAVDRSGRTRSVVTLGGVTAVDWEAIARRRTSDGTSYLFVADIGDNDRIRSQVQVHRVHEPRALSDTTLPATTYRFRYPDGRHDAETLLVHPRTGRMYIVTKHFHGGSVYVAPPSPSTTTVNTLTRIGPAPSVVTDGTFLWDGRIVLRNYQQGFVAASPGQPYRSFSLPSVGQGESVAAAANGTAILTGSEGRNSPVWHVPVPAANP